MGIYIAFMSIITLFLVISQVITLVAFIRNKLFKPHKNGVRGKKYED